MRQAENQGDFLRLDQARVASPVEAQEDGLHAEAMHES